MGIQYSKNWVKSKEQPSFVFTSNDDGHFFKAGFSNRQIIECHGSIKHLQCVFNCSTNIWHSGILGLKAKEDLSLVGKFPRCPDCGGIARPNIGPRAEQKINENYTKGC